MSTIKASNGKILVRPGGSVLATTCGQSFNCNSSINGCATCSCCGAGQYLVCITGATGDCAVINNNTTGWTISNGGSGGSYVYEDASVKLTLDLSTYVDPIFGTQSPCRDWSLKVYRKSGGLVQCLAASGSSANWGEQLDSNCQKSGTVGGITFRIKPKENWFATKARLTISGFTNCCPTCCGSSGSYHKVHYATVDGTYELPLTFVQYPGNACEYWKYNVGSFSYSLYNTADCSSAPTAMITGTFDLMVQLTGGQLRTYVRHRSPQWGWGYDHSAWIDLWGTNPAMCKTLSISGMTDYDDRCLRSLDWVRVGHGASATVVFIP